MRYVCVCVRVRAVFLFLYCLIADVRTLVYWIIYDKKFRLRICIFVVLNVLQVEVYLSPRRCWVDTNPLREIFHLLILHRAFLYYFFCNAPVRLVVNSIPQKNYTHAFFFKFFFSEQKKKQISTFCSRRDKQKTKKNVVFFCFVFFFPNILCLNCIFSFHID